MSIDAADTSDVQRDNPPSPAPGFPHAEREGYSPALTALQFAALLPPDTVPWPWLRTLTTARHPELTQFADDEPDPWLEVRRCLEGLRLLTSGDQPKIARIHRLVAAHLVQRGAIVVRPELERLIADSGPRLYFSQEPPDAWEIDTLLATLPHLLGGGDIDPDMVNELAKTAMAVSEKLTTYRSLPVASSLLGTSHQSLQRLAESDPANAEWQRDLSVSFNKFGELARAQRNLSEAQRLFGESLRIAQRLAESDPVNAAWQRDLWGSYWRVANVLEQLGSPEATPHWRMAHDTLAAMMVAGLFVSAQDQRFLNQLRVKLKP